MANVDNTKSQMRKGMLEYCILLLLRHRPSYANDIISHLKQADMIVVEGTLYPLLNRLKKDGWLKYEWQESTQGPPRKYYALTEEGEAALRQLDAAWNELANTVGILQQSFTPTAAGNAEAAAEDAGRSAANADVPAENVEAVTETADDPAEASERLPEPLNQQP